VTKTGLPATKKDQSRIAALFVRLSGQVLSAKENLRYIAPKVDDGPNSDAVNVYPSHVRCFIRSNDLVEQAKKAQLSEELTNQNKPRNKDWYRLEGLQLTHIETNKSLFRHIVKESIDTVIDRKKKRK
jgi:hypothetical protein